MTLKFELSEVEAAGALPVDATGTVLPVSVSLEAQDIVIPWSN